MRHLLRFTITSTLVLSFSTAWSAPRGKVLCELFPAADQVEPQQAEERNAVVDVTYFKKAVERVGAVYQPVFKALNQKFRIVGNWASAEFNAFAVVEDNGDRRVEIHGGLARNKYMTRDALLLVMCHEIGHHLAGNPRYPNEVLSAEGQSDYYGTLVCMRKVLATEDNQLALRRIQVDTYARQYCARQYKDSEEQAICIRSVMAGLSLARVLNLNRGPRVQDRDRTRVPATQMNHPEPQCRLDTYIAGALCPIGPTLPPVLTQLVRGACNPNKIRQGKGSRPTCWYNQAG